MNHPILKEEVIPLYETKYISLYDLQYEAGKHYFNASRRSKENLICRKTKEELKKASADAVTIITVLHSKAKAPFLVLSYEYRYPTGQFLLSPPAGLVDPEDGIGTDGLLLAARRELKEELGLNLQETDSITILNPLLFSSPGMTDESNALVLAEHFCDTPPVLSQQGAVGTELFDGYVLLTKEEALQLLKQGCDARGIFYSVYTWAALYYFVTAF